MLPLLLPMVTIGLEAGLVGRENDLMVSHDLRADIGDLWSLVKEGVTSIHNLSVRAASNIAIKRDEDGNITVFNENPSEEGILGTDTIASLHTEQRLRQAEDVGTHYGTRLLELGAITLPIGLITGFLAAKTRHPLMAALSIGATAGSQLLTGFTGRSALVRTVRGARQTNPYAPDGLVNGLLAGGSTQDLGINEIRYSSVGELVNEVTNPGEIATLRGATYLDNWAEATSSIRPLSDFLTWGRDAVIELAQA